jgi:hypothetical protein
MTKTNRINVDGTNVRFWVDQKDAQSAAETLTRITKLPFTAVEAKDLGWYVKSTREFHDADGKLPRNFNLEAKLPT